MDHRARKALGQEDGGRGLCAYHDLLAIEVRLVGVRETIGQNGCARRRQKSKCEHGGFHRISPNQFPVCVIAVGLAMIRR